MCLICGLDTLRSHDQVHCEHMAAGIWNVPALCALGKLHLLFTSYCNVFSMYLMGKLPLAPSDTTLIYNELKALLPRTLPRRTNCPR